MRWAGVIRLTALIALGSAPAAALDVGQRIGPVLMTAGGTICDTEADVVMAMNFLAGIHDDRPKSCGYIIKALPAYLVVVSHYREFAILKILFPPRSSLGIQYGWIVDASTDKTGNET